MAKPPTEPEFDRKVRFQARSISDDGYGNQISGPFEDKFTVWAALRPGGLSEAVTAARLEGNQVLHVYVRSSTQTRQITSEWQAVINDHGVARAYAITAQPDGITMPGFVYFQIKSGVAA